MITWSASDNLPLKKENYINSYSFLVQYYYYIAPETGVLFGVNHKDQVWPDVYRGGRWPGGHVVDASYIILYYRWQHKLMDAI